MNIFRGDMSLLAQLKDVRKMTGPGGLTDTSTYRASLAALVLALVMFLLGWNLDAATSDFRMWARNPIGWITSDVGWRDMPPVTRAHRIEACAWLLGLMLLACLLFYRTWASRRRARKSAQGQWYDKPGLTKEDLHGKSHGTCKTEQDKP